MINPARVRAGVLLALFALFSHASAVRAQVGMGIGFNYREIKNSTLAYNGAGLTMQFMKDFHPHLGFGIALEFSAMQSAEGEAVKIKDVTFYGLDYQAYYILGDNATTTLLLGSYAGFRGVSSTGDEKGAIAVPLGLRVAVRGSMDGGFGMAYVNFGYQLAGRLERSYAADVPLAGAELRIGFIYGGGFGF
jgi:hypothetical protein